MSALGAVAGRVELTIQSGASFLHTFTVLDSASNPVDFTGATAQMDLVSAGTVIDSLTTTTEITLGGVAGTIAIALTPATTAGYADCDFPADYDILVTYPDATADRFVYGKVHLSAAVTVL